MTVQGDLSALVGIRRDYESDFKMTSSGYHRQIGRLLSIIESLRGNGSVPRDDILEEAALAVRAGCGMCEGKGYEPGSHGCEGTECEYCGRPMAVIRALKAVKS